MPDKVQKMLCFFGLHRWAMVPVIYIEGDSSERMCSGCRVWERGYRFYRHHASGIICAGGVCSHAR